GKVRVALRRGQELIARLHQLVVAEAANILEHEVEAGSGAEAADRRRIDRDDGRVLVRGEMRVQAVDERLRGEIRGATLAPVLQSHEYHGLALTAAGEVVAVDLEVLGHRAG